jgi:hypothetical protein
MVIKRGGLYYMTMTGNHLISRGYRVDYAVSGVSPVGPYTQPEKPTLLVDTSRGHGSLGHSSSVIGPDLDSWWICYTTIHRRAWKAHGSARQSGQVSSTPQKGGAWLTYR